MIDDGDCGAIGGLTIGRRNRSTWRKPAPAPLCPPKISHYQTRDRTRAAAVGSQRLSAFYFLWRFCIYEIKDKFPLSKRILNIIKVFKNKELK
jgi:hypothetical protein